MRRINPVSESSLRVGKFVTQTYDRSSPLAYYASDGWLKKWRMDGTAIALVRRGVVGAEAAKRKKTVTVRSRMLPKLPGYARSE
jgi:hypothetical protein